MKPGIVDLPIIWRGSLYQPISFTWLDGEGNIIDLTGWSPIAKSQNIDFHPTVPDPLTGIAIITLSKEQTANLALGVEQWDWLWQNENGIRTQPLLAGTVEIKEPMANDPSTGSSTT